MRDSRSALMSMSTTIHVFDVLKEFTHEEIEEELQDMIYHDLADRALKAAEMLLQALPNGRRIVQLAARVVSNSSSYPQAAQETAKKYIL